MYRFEASSVEGFIQQLVLYVSKGYFRYVVGTIGAEKDVDLVDEKLLEKYGIAISKWARSRRKRAGIANVQYLRHERFFVLLATQGTSDFYAKEAGSVRDIKRTALRYGGYSVSFRNGHVSVRIGEDEYKRLKAYFLDLACRRNAEKLGAEFRRIPFAMYAPVRSQVLCIWRAVNRARKVSSYEPVPFEALRLGRRSVKPFEEAA